MLEHTFKTAIRYLWRNKVFSAINLLGLVVGLVASFGITSYLYHESTYDTQHPSGSQTYRLLSRHGFVKGDQPLSANNFFPIVSFIQERVPEVEVITRIRKLPLATVNIKEETFVEKRFAWADASLLKLFDIPLMEGNADQALVNPNSVIISEKDSKKFFGTENPLGAVIKVDGHFLTVTGVFRDMPTNTHLKAGLIGSLNTFKDLDNPWSHSGFIYARLNAHADTANVSAKINAALAGNVWWLADADIQPVQLQKIQDIHLHSTGIDATPDAVNIKYLYIFGIIGLILVFSTSFNYISLSIAEFTVRSKDFGVRKILGSGKRTIAMQLLMECLLLCGLAALLAIVITALLLPWVSNLLDSAIDSAFLLSMNNVALLLIIVAFLLVLSAGYPALLILQSRPISSLIKNTSAIWKPFFIRKPLMIIQFSIATTLIISLIIVQRQLDFLSSERLGFEKEQILILKTPDFSKIDAPLMKTKLQQLSGISSATVAVGTPFEAGLSGIKERNGKSYTESFFWVDTDYIKTLGMTIVEGRDLSPSDSNKIIVNETMVQIMGWEQAIGQIINLFQKPMEVQGVVRDFQLNNTQTPIHPVVIGLGKKYTNNILLRMETKNLAQNLAKVAGVWQETEPNHPMEYTFLDERFNQLYQSEIQFKRLSRVFSGIALFIACLGLYGAIVHTVRQRTKEIGIRKVLGASVTGIVQLLSKDFVKLVLTAILIASPIAWWAMNKWLENFAYRIDIEWWMFAVAGLAAVGISLLTVSFQTIKAAVANPVESLRSE